MLCHIDRPERLCHEPRREPWPIVCCSLSDRVPPSCGCSLAGDPHMSPTWWGAACAGRASTAFGKALPSTIIVATPDATTSQACELPLTAARVCNDIRMLSTCFCNQTAEFKGVGGTCQHLSQLYQHFDSTSSFEKHDTRFLQAVSLLEYSVQSCSVRPIHAHPINSMYVCLITACTCHSPRAQTAQSTHSQCVYACVMKGIVTKAHPVHDPQ